MFGQNANTQKDVEKDSSSKHILNSAQSAPQGAAQSSAKNTGHNGTNLENYSDSSNIHDASLLTEKSGVGIHTGRHSIITVVKSEEEGISFRFEDKNLSYECPAHWERLSGTTRTTALVLRGQSRRKIQVAMIEHFMAAVHIWRLNQITAKIAVPNLGDFDTVELPILDGSSLEWCSSLKATTRTPQEQTVWVVAQDFEHCDGDRIIRFEKNSTSKDSHCTEYFFRGTFGVMAQETSFTMNWLDAEAAQLDFLKRIAPARTFGFRHEIEALRARGLALGGSLDNALVIDGDHFVNPEGQRVANELASHKLLDAVGDFALAGKPILGKIYLQGTGHAFHLSALRHAFESGSLQPGFLMADGRILAACGE